MVALLDRLRREGGDFPEVEVKAAAQGYPDTLLPSLCALANRPGGGLVILGLDERSGFLPVPLADPRRLKDTLASQARQALEPPIVLDIGDAEIEGRTVVVAVVPEVDPALKPCRITGGSHRGLWLRAFDGDYLASELEIQGLLASRTQPVHDSAPAPNASTGDLDLDLVTGFLTSCRQGSQQLARLGDDELLWRMGVVVTDARTPSVAGLLALGRYPQQHLPAYGLQGVATDDSTNTRAADSRRFDGPIPAILADAVNWVTRNNATRLREDPDGAVRNEPTYPPEAVRELVANALIHRDLSPWSAGETSLLRVSDERLVIRNPGGLYGLTVQRLGRSGITSARNATLLRICQYVQLPDGSRTVEALATGIPTVLAALHRRGLDPPRFNDDGLRFTVIVRSAHQRPPATVIEGTAATILTALAAGPQTVTQLATTTGLGPANIRKHLRQLRASNFVTQHGGRGQPTYYQQT